MFDGTRVAARSADFAAGSIRWAATVDGVFSLAALIPSPPVLVPELCGGWPAVDDEHPAAQVPALREAVLAAGRALAGETMRWTVVGVAPEGAGAELDYVDAVGTFRGFGADVPVALSDSALADGLPPDPDLPLPVLIGGWLRGRVAPEATVEARLIAADSAVADCAALGARLRRDLGAEPGPRGVLVVADGATTLSTKAPGYLDSRAEAAQAGIDRALDAGDCAALAELDTTLCAELGVSGRAAYQVLAGLFGAGAADGRPGVETLYRAAPFGVGYHVSLWRPGAGA
ncbi:hypothetical protein ABIA39_001160 [Nocardia sp. GAS34]